MDTDYQPLHRVHQGRNLQRIRQTRNVKQCALAEDSGIPQQTISRYEQMETIPDKAID
ncbi:MAG: helix-turn-helix domain-containing protein, partial [Parabacteroides sp.]|nr:helix-turn-helix domain-containing protein [Parabacteroides sp.]